MRAAASCGAPVPEAREVIEVAGRPGLVLERVDGQDLLTMIGKRPWLVWSLGALTGRLHATLHQADAPMSLPALRARMRARIERSELVPTQLARFALDALETLPDGDRVCHGDFHPGNIILTDRAPAIIDWANATRGDPTADYARTVLMLRIGEPPPGSPAVVRFGARFARRLMLAAYRRAYRRQRTVDTALVARWEAPVLAVRLTEHIAPERRALLRMLEARATAPPTRA